MLHQERSPLLGNSFSHLTWIYFSEVSDLWATENNTNSKTANTSPISRLFCRPFNCVNVASRERNPHYESTPRLHWLTAWFVTHKVTGYSQKNQDGSHNGATESLLVFICNSTKTVSIMLSKPSFLLLWLPCIPPNPAILTSSHHFAFGSCPSQYFASTSPRNNSKNNRALAQHPKH